MATRTRTVEHVGEWRVTMVADSVEALFTEVARVLARAGGKTAGGKTADADTSRADTAGPPRGPWERIAVQARDIATLLVDWANELIGRAEIASAAYDEVRALQLEHRPDGVALSAEVRGRPVRGWRSPVKAATYHGLSVAPVGARWSATILFDV